MTTTDPVDSLTLQLLEWVAKRTRTYEEAMEAWRTHCPRFPIWEDAVEAGLIEAIGAAGGLEVRLTDAGGAALRAAGLGKHQD